MHSAFLLAQRASDSLPANWAWILVGLIGVLFLLLALLVFFSFINLWLQAFLTGARVGFFDLVAMKFRKVDYGMLVRQKIALVQAGVKVGNDELEAHYLARGNVPKVATAVIAAHKAGIDLPWRIAAAIDLAGRDILDAVKTSVNPKVIDCPDPSKGRPTLDGVCKNGIQLKARARVTVRTKLDRLVGGATEETITNLISQAVLKNSLDSQTAFEIVSIDVAEIDVGANIGANLQADQAGADLRVAQARAERTRAEAVAQEQVMRAMVEENRAKVVLSEAEIPLAIAQAFREGKLGVMEYYNLRNVQSDTEMRNSIATIGSRKDRSDRPLG